MAKASALIPGSKAVIISGDHAGHTVTILDNKPIPDGGDQRAGAEHQRTILVNVHGVGADDETFPFYVLPRLLDPRSEADLAAKGTGKYDGLPSNLIQTVTVPTAQEAPMLTISTELPLDPMHSVYDVFRPDPTEVDRYLNREMYGMTDVEFFLKLREARDEQGFAPNIMLEGDTQGGKSTFVRIMAIASARADGMPKPYPVFSLDGAIGVTQFEMYGQNAVVNREGRELLVWMTGIVAMACRVGGLLNLAELNALPPNMAIAMHSVLDNTRRFLNTAKPVEVQPGLFLPEEVRVNSNLWCWSSCNDNYRGTQVLSEALRNRFEWFSWGYDEKVEEVLVPLGAARSIVESLRLTYEGKLTTVPIGTTAAMRLVRNATMFGVKFAIDSLVAMYPGRERDYARQAIFDKKKVEALTAEVEDLLQAQPM